MGDETKGHKTDTIKERAIYVYLPSLEMVEDWKGRAEKGGVSISKFVIERVEESIRREEGEEGYLGRAELIKKLRDAEEELKKLRNENRLLKKLAENLDNELRRYRAQPFLEEAFEGVRRFDRDLIELLRKGGSYTQEQILAHLNIDPSDSDLLKAVSKQLEVLEGYGLLEYKGRGWKWKA
jgi:translation initiation factor 2B subunit (eIF-2B alpha/beta/delta family)